MKGNVLRNSFLWTQTQTTQARVSIWGFNSLNKEVTKQETKVALTKGAPLEETTTNSKDSAMCKTSRRWARLPDQSLTVPSPHEHCLALYHACPGGQGRMPGGVPGRECVGREPTIVPPGRINPIRLDTANHGPAGGRPGFAGPWRRVLHWLGKERWSIGHCAALPAFAFGGKSTEEQSGPASMCSCSNED